MARERVVASNGSSDLVGVDVGKEGDIEADSFPAGFDVDEKDFKKKQVFKGWMLMWLAYQATGVIYGDIGTSPLYVYSSTFTAEPGYDDLLGALSIIIWSITIIVTIKYVLIVLLADDEGEGGTFALYSLLSRYSNISERDMKTKNMYKLERYATMDMKPMNRGIRDFMEKSTAIRVLLKMLAVFGVSLVIADGVLTPAQSVLGAVQGLRVIREDISTSVIIGVSCAILILLFFAQPLGITKLGSVFAPIVIIWLLFNFTFGIYNLVVYDHSVLKAISPHYAILFLVRNKTRGWQALGGLLLAFTGVEALFADLGAFSKRAIQISWIGFAYPCLLLAYIGQAAFISRIPSAYSNPFFKTVPPGMFYPSFVISILAAIVASQALITSTFQLLSQVMNTSYFPQITKIYTSDKFHGQVYIPLANWLLMIGTVVVTAVYSNTTRLGQAYGVCVILVTFITTCMVALVALVVWRLHWALVLLAWIPFIALDGLYMSSALVKVPEGAWFTLLLAAILSSSFILWRYGKEKQWRAEGDKRFGLNELLTISNGTTRLSPQAGGHELSTIRGIGIFFDKVGDYSPTPFVEFVRKFEAQPEVCVFLHLRALWLPYAPAEDRYAVISSGNNYYRVIIRYGYNEHVVNPDLGTLVAEQIRQHLLHESRKIADTPPQDDSQTDLAGRTNVSARIATLDRSLGSQIVYIVGNEQLRLIHESKNIVSRVALRIFIWLRENTGTKVATLKIPIDKLVEVGFVREM